MIQRWAATAELGLTPQMAVDLARWISAPFAVWMDGWFQESAGKTSKPRARCCAT